MPKTQICNRIILPIPSVQPHAGSDYYFVDKENQEKYVFHILSFKFINARKLYPPYDLLTMQRGEHDKRLCYACVLLICFMTLQGLPPAITSAGMLFTTTDPAAIIDRAPIVTPLPIMQLVPIKTSSSITTGFV